MEVLPYGRMIINVEEILGLKKKNHHLARIINECWNESDEKQDIHTVSNISLQGAF